MPKLAQTQAILSSPTVGFVNSPRKENWATQFGVILAVTGSAVGLGNFLRFPGQVATYGGGAFMIPYFVAFLLLGIPIAWAEWTIGRYAGVRGFNSAPGIFRCVTGKRGMAYCGSLCVTLTTIIFSYYIFIEGWCLLYAVRYLTGSIGSGSSEYFAALFNQTSGMAGHGTLFQGGLLNPSLLGMFACFAFNFFLIYRGVVKGIEWFCKLALPALLICSFVILFRVLTLGNPTGLPGQSVLDGLNFVWNPAAPGKTILQTLSDPKIWLAGAGQVFFSLSLGFGVICTYASYTRRRDDIALSSLTAAAGNGFCEAVVAVMMVVPATFIFFGPAFLDPAFVKANLGNSFGLGFQTLPNVFAQMPLGNFFGFLFFSLLFLAAVTSSISTLQPGIALLEEGLRLNRKASVTIMGLITLVGACFTAYFTDKLTALDTFDFWVANILIFIMAGVQVFMFGWVLGLKTSMAELERGAAIKIPRFYCFVMKYVSPLYLLVVFVAWAFLSMPDYLAVIRDNKVVQMSIGFMTLVMLFNFFVTAQAVTHWEKEDRLKQDAGLTEGEL